MPGYPPRHVYAACWRELLTYFTYRDKYLCMHACGVRFLRGLMRRAIVPHDPQQTHARLGQRAVPTTAPSPLATLADLDLTPSW